MIRNAATEESAVEDETAGPVENVNMDNIAGSDNKTSGSVAEAETRSEGSATRPFAVSRTRAWTKTQEAESDEWEDISDSDDDRDLSSDTDDRKDVIEMCKFISPARQLRLPNQNVLLDIDLSALGITDEDSEDGQKLAISRLANEISSRDTTRTPARAANRTTTTPTVRKRTKPKFRSPWWRIPKVKRRQVILPSRWPRKDVQIEKESGRKPNDSHNDNGENKG